MARYEICNNCIMDTSDPMITFDDHGQCDHCNNYYNYILPRWNCDEKSETYLSLVAEQIRHDGQGKSHNCLIGISGGVDSSYLTYIAREKLGLTPLIFHVDAGWNSQEATNNIERLIDVLGLDLHTEVINWPEFQDLQLAFLKAQVPYVDVVQDLAFFSCLYNFASKYGFKYILTGSNHSTECVRQPLEWAYYATDTKHIRDIHRRFGTRPLKTFPMASIFRYKIYDRLVKGVRVIKPLNYINYIRENAIKELVDKFGWQTYPHKHYESRCTRFIESYWMPEKFGYDNRRAHFSSLILTKQMTREEAMERISKKAYDEATIAQDIEYFATKLDITVQEFHELFNGENRSFKDYKNNKFLIELGNKLLHMFGNQRMLIR